MRTAALVTAAGLALAIPAAAQAATPKQLGRCVTAWNARSTNELHRFAAKTTRRVALTVRPLSGTPVGGVRSLQATEPNQACTVLLHRSDGHWTRVVGVWLHGEVRVWVSSTLPSTSEAPTSRNVRLLPDGRLSL